MTRASKRDIGHRLGALEGLQAANEAPPRVIHIASTEPDEDSGAALARAGLDPNTPIWTTGSAQGPSIILVEPPARTVVGAVQ